MRLSRCFVVALVIAAPITAACSLLTDFNGLSDTIIHDEAGASDANSAVNDGSSETSSANGDANAEASSSGSTQPFCKNVTGAAFCEDFDEGILKEAWNENGADPKGVIELSSTQAVSKPSSFHASLGRRAKDDKESAYVRQHLMGSWQHTVIDFDIFMVKPSWEIMDVNADVFEIDFIGTTGARSIGLAVGETYMQFFADAVVIDNQGGPIFDRFFHVQLDLDPIAGAVHAIIDGKASAGSMSFGGVGPGSDTLVQFGVLGYNAPCPQFSVFYDNIVITRQ